MRAVREMLEPCAVRVACAVPRGAGGRKVRDNTLEPSSRYILPYSLDSISIIDRT